MNDDSSGQNAADASRKKRAPERGEQPVVDAQAETVAHDALSPQAHFAAFGLTADKSEVPFPGRAIDDQPAIELEELDPTDPATASEQEAQSKRQLLSQATTSEDVPRPAKITVVRSQKSLTDLPAMSGPATAAQTAAPIAAPNAAPHATKTAAQTSARNNQPHGDAITGRTPAEATPVEVNKTTMLPGNDKPAADASLSQARTGSATGAYISDASTTSHPEIVSEQDVTVLTESIDASLLTARAKVRPGADEPVVLSKHPTVSRHNARPTDGDGRRSDTRFVLPMPDQPVPPPQAPPQFLTDQGHTRPADSSLDRSQFGTASKHGGAPIALLTNVNRNKKKTPSKAQPVFDFIKNNLISCALSFAIVLLLALLLVNRDPKNDAISNLDLTILNSGQQLDQVNHLVNGKKYEAALQLCDVVIQKDTKYAEAYHARGQVYMAMHRYREAVDDFTTAESYNHRSIDIHIDRAAALYNVQDFEKAKREYDEILTTEPNNAAAHFGRGLAEESLGNSKEAIDDFKKTLALQSDYGAAYEEMGTVHFGKGDLKAAYEDYTNAIKIAPTEPRFYFNRANALKQDHQIKLAIADYCKAIQLDPSRPEFFNNRGLLYLENDEPSKALTDFSSAVDLDPNYTIAKHNLTLAQERVRR